MKHSLGFLSVLVCMTVWLLTPGEAEAQADTIYACVNNSSGTIKIVDPLELCRRNEIELIWNAAGPQGPQGPPGEQGPPGPLGSIDGSEVFDVFVKSRGGNTSDFVVASFCSLSVVGFTDLRDVEGPKDRE